MASTSHQGAIPPVQNAVAGAPRPIAWLVSVDGGISDTPMYPDGLVVGRSYSRGLQQLQQLGHRVLPFFEFPESALNDVHCMLVVQRQAGNAQDSPTSTPHSAGQHQQYKVTLCNMSDHIIHVNDLQLAPEQQVALEDGDWICLTQGGEDGHEEEGIEMQYRTADNGSCTPTPSSPTATPSVSVTPSSTAYTSSSHHPSAGQTPHHAAANPFSSSQRNAGGPADRFQAVADLFLDNLPYCPLCQGLLDAAVQLQPCGHAFCATCLSHELGTQLQSAAVTLSCPLGCPCPQLVVSAIRQRVRVNTFLLHGSPPPARCPSVTLRQTQNRPLPQLSGIPSVSCNSIAPTNSGDSSSDAAEFAAPLAPLDTVRGASTTAAAGSRTAATAESAAPRGYSGVRPVNSAPDPSSSSQGRQSSGPVQPASERPPTDPDLPLLDLILRWAQDYAYLQSAAPSGSPQSRQASTVETESAMGRRESGSETSSMGSSPHWPPHTHSLHRSDRSDAEPSLHLAGIRESGDQGSSNHSGHHSSSRPASVHSPSSRPASMELPSSSWPQPVRVTAVLPSGPTPVLDLHEASSSGQHQHGSSPVFSSSSMSSSAVETTLQQLAQLSRMCTAQNAHAAQGSPSAPTAVVVHVSTGVRHTAHSRQEGSPDANVHDGSSVSSYQCSSASHHMPSPRGMDDTSPTWQGRQEHGAAGDPGQQGNGVRASMMADAHNASSNSMHSSRMQQAIESGLAAGSSQLTQPVPGRQGDGDAAHLDHTAGHARRGRSGWSYSHPTSPSAAQHHYCQHSPHAGNRRQVGTPDRMQGTPCATAAPVHSVLSAMHSCMAGHTTYRLSPSHIELQQVPQGLSSPDLPALPFAARGLESPSSSRSTHSHIQLTPRRHCSLAAEIASTLTPLSPGWQLDGAMPRTHLTGLGLQYNPAWHEQVGLPVQRRRSVCLSDLGTPRTLLAAAAQLLHPSSPVPLSPAAAVAVAAASLASTSPAGGRHQAISTSSSPAVDVPPRPCACGSPSCALTAREHARLTREQNEDQVEGGSSPHSGRPRLHVRWLHLLQSATEDDSSPDSHSHSPRLPSLRLLSDGHVSPHAPSSFQAAPASPGAVLDQDSPQGTPPRRMAVDGTSSLHFSRHAPSQRPSSAASAQDARTQRRCTRDSLPRTMSPQSYSFHMQNRQDQGSARSGHAAARQPQTSTQSSSSNQSEEEEGDVCEEEGGEDVDSIRSSLEATAMFKAPHSMHVLCELHDFRLPMDLTNWRASLVDRILLQLRVAIGPPAGSLSVGAMVRTLEMMARLAWASPDIKDALATGGAIPKLVAVLHAAAGPISQTATAAGVTAPAAAPAAAPPAGQAPAVTGSVTAAALAAGYGSRTSGTAAGPPPPTTIAGAAAARAPSQPTQQTAATAPAAAAPAAQAPAAAAAAAASQGACGWSGSAAVAAAGCMAVASLVVGAGDVCLTNQWDIAKALGVEAIAAVMAAHPQETVVQLAALMAFSPLASNNPMMQANICQGALQVILAALQRHQGAAAVQAKGMVLLGVMVQGEEALLDAVRTCMLEAHVEQLVMAALQRHGLTADAALWPCLFATSLLLADGRLQLARSVFAKQKGFVRIIRQCTEAHIQRSIANGEPEDELIMGASLRVLHVLEDEQAARNRRMILWLGGLSAAALLGIYGLYTWRCSTDTHVLTSPAPSSNNSAAVAYGIPASSSASAAVPTDAMVIDRGSFK